jgi:hypothetical protein
MSATKRDDPVRFRTEESFNEVEVSAENQRHETDHPIVCQDLAYAYLTGRKGFLDNVLQSKQAIKDYFDTEEQSQVDITTMMEEAAATSSQRQLVGNAQFGSFFADLIGQMEGCNLNAGGAIIQTNDHVMAAKIQIKPEDDKEARFVLSFYDPNKTGRHKRMELPRDRKDPLAPLSALTFTECFDFWKDYFRQDLPEDEAAVIVTPMGLGGIELPEPTARKYLPDDQMTPQDGIAFAMKSNMPDLLRDLGDKMVGESISDDQAVEWLAGAQRLRSDGATAIIMAAEYGHADVVTAYGALLEKAKLSPEQVVRLLGAQASDGATAIFMTAAYGHADVVTAYGALLEKAKLLPDQVVRLLGAARPSDGGTAIIVAAQEGHADVVTAYGALLEKAKLSPDQVAGLLGARTSDGETAIFMAAQEGHVPVLVTYVEVLHRLGIQGDQAHELLTAKGPKGDSPREAALKNKKHEFVKAYDALVAQQ